MSEEQLPDATAFAIDLATEELFTNLVRHNRASSPSIEVGLCRSADEIRLELEDRDVDAFDPELLPEVDPTLPLEDREPGGLGVYLVQSCFDELKYQYADRVLTVTATRKVGPRVRNSPH